MHYQLDPNVGANQLKFGMERDAVRQLFSHMPMTKQQEPENDFYEIDGLILGYDQDEKLEYIEIIKPSTAEYQGIDFYSITLKECISEMEKNGYSAPYDDGGYNFESLGMAFYCPQGFLESVSLYKEGYYDDL